MLAVLWVLVALSAVVGLGVGAVRLGQTTSANRVFLIRGRWAAEACLAVAEARWAAHRLGDTATVDLGRETRCAWRVDDPTARVNVNTTSATLLHAVAQLQGVAASTIDTILAHRPYPDTAAVRVALGPDSACLALFTTDGPGMINANAAVPAVLQGIPGMGPQTVEVLAEARRLGRPIASLDQLLGAVPGDRPALLGHYADLAAILTFSPPQLLLTATGWVDGGGGPDGLHATIEELVVPLPDRLAVIRRRMW